MKGILLNLFSLFLGISLIFSQNPPAYQIFDAQGNKVSYKQMVEKLATADVVFFGELHNNAIAHWLELRIAKDLYKNLGGKLTLGAEMFEADVQLIIDEFLTGHIREKDVKKEARVWPNYPTDYRPLLMFAKNKNLKFIATNIPRRYANLVYRKGFEALDKLSDQAKTYIAPLPIEYDPNLECYKNMLSGALHTGMPANPNLAKAQAIKDATMAYFISKNLPTDGIFIHYNGAYHSDNHQGIVWYLQKYKPNLKILTITTVEQKAINKLADENKNKADFIIAVPADMTKTY